MEKRGNKPTPDTVTTVEHIGGEGSIHLQIRTVGKKPDGTDIIEDIIYGTNEQVPSDVLAKLKK